MVPSSESPCEFQPLALRVPAACHVLGIGKSSIYELFKSGELKSVRIAGRRLVLREDIDALIAKAREAA